MTSKVTLLLQTYYYQLVLLFIIYYYLLLLLLLSLLLYIFVIVILLTLLNLNESINESKASPKLEYGARTIRSKISTLIPTYLTPYPEVVESQQQQQPGVKAGTDWKVVYESLQINRDVQPVNWILPGYFII